MTRTHPPDILASTLYRDISPQQCDLKMIDKSEIINKRHCRSFDFIESLDDPQSFTSPMEYPYKRPENQTPNKDLMWNGLDQPGHLRFSSPDLFNSRQIQQHTPQDKPSHLTWSDSIKRSRSKSAPRFKTTLTPVPISVSPPTTRKGREAPQAASDTLRSSETQPEPFSSSRSFVNDVHPIKLQPHPPLYVSDCFDGEKQDKPTMTPHVRCRVDIKPDAAVLQHTSRQIPNVRPDPLWQRYSQASSSRGLYGPRRIVSSPTPTPSECYSGDFRQGYHYTTSMSPISYQHLDVHRLPSPTGLYLSQEQRAYSNPNIPTKFFYTEDAVRYPVHPYSRYFQDDRSSLASHGSSMTSQYDPRTRWVHTLPVRSYYTDHFSNRGSTHSLYGRPYSTSEMGSSFSQPISRAYYGGDSRLNPSHVSSSGSFYSKSLSSPEEQHFPFRPYHTEGRRRPPLSQAFTDDWYRSSISGYSNQSFQHTPLRVKPDHSTSPWFTSSPTDTSRLGAEAKNHSQSWDNILYPRQDREASVPRGRSYDNLFYQARQTTSSDVTSQPVILNLSSSPRRYAALSLSENSLERGSSNPWRSTKNANWFVTPEITITDNDICAGNKRRHDVHYVSGDMADGKKKPSMRVAHQKQQYNTAEVTKDRIHNNFSLQQSLEQLDELLADLVVDYKPPNTRKSSEEILDQLKQLITHDNDKDAESPGSESLGVNPQLPSCKSSPDTIKDPDSGCDALQRSTEECSPDHSADEDDTMVCANKKCNRVENMFNACLYYKSCHSCYTFYCSRNCRRDDWDTHKETCLYGRVSSVCRHTLRFCRENSDIHKAFSRLAKAGYLSRGRGVLFLGFANPETADNFLQVGLESLLMSPTYLSLRELDGFKDNLGEYCKELQHAGDEYDPDECFLLNVSIAVGELVPNRPSPRVQAPTVRKYAKVSLASSSPEKRVLKKDTDMETLILTPPPGTPDIDKEGEDGRKSREVCFVNIQRELRTRGVFLRHEYPKIYTQLCEFVENNKRFTPTTIYPIDKRTGKQFMCMIMAASEPRTLDWVGTPHLLDDII
ncbi:apical junction component 1 homolog [Gouania willdenowi]|uniref:Apical junction component 1 homolog n=1 Tax=Gouania willdenowi TaxID=441366 RepID=A0A8C5DXF4_GOUWI|nr:apical junction component 1 homolog [Gouania willdenowi]